MKKVFNMSNILGTAAFISLIASVAAAESETYILSFLLLIAFSVCAHLSIKEGGGGHGV